MRRPTALAATALLVLLAPLGALADAVRVSLSPKALVGQGVPTLDVHILEPIAGFEVRLRRSDGQDVVVRGGGKPGVTRSVRLEQPEGRFHYEGELVVNFPDASQGSLPLSFDAELNGPPTLTVRREDLDLARRTLRFTSSRPLVRARLTVRMDTGQTAFDGEVPLKGEPFEVRWPEAPGRVLELALTAWDASDFFTGVKLFPWQVDIPHEEVHFASGKADVPATERGKLDQSYALVADALRQYGRFAKLQLFVLGHTDRVGDAQDNRALSLARARAIAAYFRKKGLRVPVRYEGFGEESPRVATADGVDEPKNRRAEYIVAVEEPHLASAPFAPRWRTLEAR